MKWHVGWGWDWDWGWGWPGAAAIVELMSSYWPNGRRGSRSVCGRVSTAGLESVRLGREKGPRPGAQPRGSDREISRAYSWNTQWRDAPGFSWLPNHQGSRKSRKPNGQFNDFQPNGKLKKHSNRKTRNQIWLYQYNHRTRIQWEEWQFFKTRYGICDIFWNLKIGIKIQFFYKNLSANFRD